MSVVLFSSLSCVVFVSVCDTLIRIWFQNMLTAKGQCNGKTPKKQNAQDKASAKLWKKRTLNSNNNEKNSQSNDYFHISSARWLSAKRKQKAERIAQTQKVFQQFASALRAEAQRANIESKIEQKDCVCVLMRNPTSNLIYNHLHDYGCVFVEWYPCLVVAAIERAQAKTKTHTQASNTAHILNKCLSSTD